jgi:DNA-directed RNA polymerase subunit RPC12/RpoP
LEFRGKAVLSYYSIRMPKLFNCIACSAPLEFEGTTIQKCRYCGASVIVPGEMFQQADSRFAPAGKFGGRAEKLAEIRRLISSGNKIAAIKEFRETFGTGLKEAKDAVDAIERGESVEITSTHTAPRQIDIQLDPRVMKRAGIAAGGTVLIAIAASAVIFVGIAVAAFLVLGDDSPAPASSDISYLSGETSGGAVQGGGPIELLRVGGEGTGVGRFKDNRSVAVDGRGTIYSGDYSGGRVQAFNADGSFATQWELGDSNLIFDLAASRQGVVYVLSNKGIRSYSADDRSPLNSYDSYRLRGLAVLPDGRVVAVGRNGITFLDPSLKVLNDYPKAAEDANSSFGFEKVAVDGSGTIFVLERSSGDVVKFSKEGKFLNRIPTGDRSPNAIALDPVGNIYITHTSSIAVFTPDGRPMEPIKATQAFGLTFNDAGEMFVASRPYVIKQKLALD